MTILADDPAIDLIGSITLRREPTELFPACVIWRTSRQVRVKIDHQKKHVWRQRPSNKLPRIIPRTSPRPRRSPFAVAEEAPPEAAAPVAVARATPVAVCRRGPCHPRGRQGQGAGTERTRKPSNFCKDSYARIHYELSKVIVGQSDVVQENSHRHFHAEPTPLLVGVPGLAKTLLISTLAQTLQMSFSPHPVLRRI